MRIHKNTSFWQSKTLNLTIEKYNHQLNTKQKTEDVTCGRFGHYINECSKYYRYKNNKYNKHTKPRRTRYKNSKKGPRKDSFKYKKRNNQLNSMESTNSYAANTLSKDYNTEDTSFIGCISTEDNTVLPSNDHLENFNSFTISN